AEGLDPALAAGAHVRAARPGEHLDGRRPTIARMLLEARVPQPLRSVYPVIEVAGRLVCVPWVAGHAHVCAQPGSELGGGSGCALTISYLLRTLEAGGPKSLEVCALLTNPSRREVDLACRYVGFEIPNRFVIGYGLDYGERYRSLPFVAVLDETRLVGLGSE